MADLMPVLLLLLLALALGAGAAMVWLVVRGEKRPLIRVPRPTPPGSFVRSFVPRPSCWLAVKSTNLQAVQTALHLHKSKPCLWVEGLDEKLFVAPPVKGWILVFGSRLPDPADDVDACFRFIAELSRELGSVQLFSASSMFHHHAWIRAERGKIKRAYAWADRTLWNQGPLSTAEKDLDLTCLGYEDSGPAAFSLPQWVNSNVEKVPMLAARWSLDPAGIDQRLLEHEVGIAGEPSRRYP